MDGRQFHDLYFQESIGNHLKEVWTYSLGFYLDD